LDFSLCRNDVAVLLCSPDKKPTLPEFYIGARTCAHPNCEQVVITHQFTDRLSLLDVLRSASIDAGVRNGEKGARIKCRSLLI
jgi:hypothetical protein